MNFTRVVAVVMMLMVVVLLVASFVGVCQAQPYGPGKPTPEQNAKSGINEGLKGVMAGVKKLVSWTLFVVEALLGLLIIHRGILVVAGGPETAETAKASLRNVFLGFAVLYGLGVILTTCFWVGGVVQGSELWKLYIPFGVPWT